MLARLSSQTNFQTRRAVQSNARFCPPAPLSRSALHTTGKMTPTSTFLRPAVPRKLHLPTLVLRRAFSWSNEAKALVRKAKKPIKRKLETPTPKLTNEPEGSRWRIFEKFGPKLGILGFGSGILAMVGYGLSLEAGYIDDTNGQSPRIARNAQDFARQIRSLMAQTYGWFVTGLCITAGTGIWVTRPFLLPHFLMWAPFDIIGGCLIGGFMAFVAAVFWGRDWVNSRTAVFTMFHCIMGLWVVGWWMLTGVTFHQTMIASWCALTSMGLVAMTAPNEDYLRNMTLFAVLMGLGLGGSINALLFTTDTIWGEAICYSVAGFGGAFLSAETMAVCEHAKTAMIFDPMFFSLVKCYMPNVRLKKWLQGGTAYSPAPTVTLNQYNPAEISDLG